MSRFSKLALSALFLLAAADGPALATDDDPRWGSSRQKVAILVFDGVQIIDFTGPYEVFGQAGFEVFTVAESTDPVTTGMGMTILPHHDLQSAPAADIVVLPGGAVPHRLPPDDARLPWIRRVAEESAALLSVCNGAFYLASAGLLEGQRATTYALMLDHLSHFAEGVTVVDDERVVDNGKIVTAGGLSAGIDGALHLVARFLGQPRAREVANNMEYDWRPHGDYVRAQLADVHAQKILDYHPPAPQRISEVYEGDATRWDVQWRIRWPNRATDMLDQMRAAADMAGWTAAGDSESTRQVWHFSDDRDHRWSVEASADEVAAGELRLQVSVRRLD